MYFGFDLDGTITAIPDQLRAIAEGLLKEGHEVYVITGSPQGSPGFEFLDHYDIDQIYGWEAARLSDLNFPFTKLVVVEYPWAKNKVDVCLALGVNLMFEDRIDYLIPLQWAGIPCALITWPRISGNPEP